MEYIATTLKQSLRIDSIVSVHYYEYTPRFRYEGEAHDFWELIYCDKGSLRLQAGDRQERLESGQAFLHPPNQFHNVRTAEKQSANSVIFSFYSDSEALLQIADRVLPTDSYTANALFSVLREARASFQNPLGKLYDARLERKEREDRFGSEQVIQNYIELMMIHLIRENDSHGGFPMLPVKDGETPILKAAMAYLEKNMGKKIVFSELTAHCSVSATTLKTLFRKHCGCGAMEYLAHLRIERAKRLLLEETRSCTEIAEACGFCSVHHFSKVFKDRTQMSPTEYLRSVKAMLETTE